MSPDNYTLLELNNAGVKTRTRWLVRHVDLKVNEGEIITIIGPNGSGKTTTLKMLTGLLPPDEGQLIVGSDHKIAYVPQKLNMDTTMPLSVTRLMKIGNNACANDIVSMLNNFQIGHLANQQVQTLSGGELQRLLLARAILRQPRLLILDEPAQGIDYAGQVEIYDYIKTYRDKSGAAIVLVSHDLHLVMAATDRVICMNGHICCSGTPQSVRENPRYLELLGPDISSHLAVYRHDHDHEHLPDGRVRHRDGTITTDCHPADDHKMSVERTDV